ncbi:MAG: hypothetical protein WC223_11080 [Bacteroidales bacterium]|jgi:hypothetical protein
MNDLSNYEKLKEDTHKFYNEMRGIQSPALNECVYFNSEGFNHIIFKKHRSEREKPSQMLRFKLISLAKKLIEKSTTYQEFEETLKEFEIKSYKKRIKKTKPVRYWGIIAIIENRKIKVILRKVGDNGNIQFWSVIPAWVTNKYRDIKLFSTMKGNPDED